MLNDINKFYFACQKFNKKAMMYYYQLKETVIVVYGKQKY